MWRKAALVMATPINVRSFGGDGFVLAAQDVAQLFDGEVQFHNVCESDRPGGTKAVQAKRSGSTNRQSLIQMRCVDYETLAQIRVGS